MDVIKNKDEILFNHYLMQKENLQRLKGDLPKGQFYLTIRTACNDLQVSFAKTQRIIKKFEELRIINLIQKGKPPKTPSIYSYNSIFTSDTIPHTISDTIGDTINPSNINGLDIITDTITESINDTITDTPKKENIKRNIKKNIFIENSKEMNLSKLLFSLMQINNPKAKQPNFQNWSKEFDYILRIDNKNIEEVERVIRWCQHDSFWKSNILSPKKLREKYDQLYLKMIEENNKNQSAKYNFLSVSNDRDKYYR